MNCPDAATLAEVSGVFEGDIRTALAHITTCPECRETLALYDQLATSARPVDVPAALYDRLDAAIMTTARETVASPASQPIHATDRRWPWHTGLLGAAAAGVSLVLLAAMAPSTSNRPVDWPALIVLSVLGGLALTIIERRIAR